MGGFGIQFLDLAERFSNPLFYNGEYVSAVGDVDGDGFSDVATVDGWLFFGSPTLAKAHRAQPISTSAINSGFHPTIRQLKIDRSFEDVTALGDINGDGFDDFGELERSTIRLGSDTGQFDRIRAIVNRADTYQSVGDFTGDGISDLLVVDEPRATYVLPGRELVTGEEFEVRNEELDIKFQGLAQPIGDVNGDGRADLLFGNKIVFADDYEWLEEGIDIDALPSGKTVSIEVDGEAYDIFDMTHGDINGDGFEDMLLLGPEIGSDAPSSSQLTTLLGSSTLPPVLNIADLADTEFIRPAGTGSLDAMIDLNGDGRDDLVSRQPCGPRSFMFCSASLNPNGDMPLQIATHYDTPVHNGFDINGDGFEDLILGSQDLMIGSSIIFGRAHGVTHDVDISQPLHLPPRAAVEFEVTGTLIRDLDDIAGTISLQLQDHQFILGEEISQSISIDVPAAVPPVAGDVDGDGVVGDADLRALIAGFGKQNALREDGDLDEDGVVSFSDYLILSANYDQPTPLSSHPTGA